MPKVDFTINIWNLVALVGTLLTIAWRGGAMAASLIARLEALTERFTDHEKADEKRFEGITTQLRDVQMAQGKHR